MKRSKLSTLFALHLMLMLYSMSEICSKKAAGESFLSVRFCLYYGTVILLLGAALVIAGVILFERADGEAAESEADHG